MMGVSTSKPTKVTNTLSPNFHRQAQALSPFNRLPYELRYQIWVETLEPRLIFLSPHQRISPPAWDPVAKEYIDSPRPTVSVRFNHSIYQPVGNVDIDSSSKAFTPSRAFAQYAALVAPRFDSVWPETNPDEAEYYRFYATRPLGYRSSAPPAALLVCRESREIALQKGYVLAFKGMNVRLEGQDKEFWERNNLSEKGVWVDFERDLLMLDCVWRNMMYSKCAPLAPLRLLKSSAPEDVGRIKRLALCGQKGWVAGALKGRQTRSQAPGAPVWQREYEWFVGLGFVNLEEIWIDDFEAEIGSPETLADKIWTVEKILRDMEEGKRRLSEWPTSPWTTELPVVKVVRGEEWNRWREF